MYFRCRIPNDLFDRMDGCYMSVLTVFHILTTAHTVHIVRTFVLFEKQEWFNNSVSSPLTGPGMLRNIANIHSKLVLAMASYSVSQVSDKVRIKTDDVPLPTIV